MASIGNYSTLVRRLVSGGATVSSILAFPIRRRLTGENRVTLRSGMALSSPATEPLLHLFQEIFVDRHYAIQGYT
jgi:hypothetical protein